jgi:hypothetical protein
MGMSMEIEKPLFVCVNVGERMWGTQPVCGELFTQEDRQMSATCVPMAGLGNSGEEVVLSASLMH